MTDPQTLDLLRRWAWTKSLVKALRKAIRESQCAHEPPNWPEMPEAPPPDGVWADPCWKGRYVDDGEGDCMYETPRDKPDWCPACKVREANREQLHKLNPKLAALTGALFRAGMKRGGDMSAAEYHLRCYRGTCDRHADPRCWNRITNGLYCTECARAITLSGESVRGPLFPYMDLPQVETGEWAWPCIRVRPAHDPATCPCPNCIPY